MVSVDGQGRGGEWVIHKQYLIDTNRISPHTLKGGLGGGGRVSTAQEGKQQGVNQC